MENEAFNAMKNKKILTWPDISWIIKWTLKNVKYLDDDEKGYLLEKAVDECHFEYMRWKNKNGGLK